MGNANCTYSEKENHCYQDGNLTEALNYHKKALIMAEKNVPRSACVARIHSDIGVVHRAIGNFHEAIKELQTARHIAEKASADATVISSILNELAETYEIEGSSDEVMDLYEQAQSVLRYSHQEHSIEAAVTYNNIGCAYERRGDLTASSRYFLKAIAIKEVYAPNSISLAATYSNIGSVCKAEGNLDDALKYYEKSVSVKEDIPHSVFSVATTYNNIGSVYAYNMKLI